MLLFEIVALVSHLNVHSNFFFCQTDAVVVFLLSEEFFEAVE